MLFGKADGSLTNMEEVHETNRFLKAFRYYNNLRIRIPYFLEERFGLNMQHKIISTTPAVLNNSLVREAIKNRDLDEIKQEVFTGRTRIDDSLDLYTCHTILHDVVILD